MKPIRALLIVLVLAATFAGFLATPATTYANHPCAYFGGRYDTGTLVVDYTADDGGWFVIGSYRSDNIRVWLSNDGKTVHFQDRGEIYLGPTLIRGSLKGTFPVGGGTGEYMLVDRTHGTTIKKTSYTVTIANCPE